MLEASDPLAYSLKTAPLLLEKRKLEGSDWKCMKKIDYQRLETVLEEVQGPSEGTSSKCGAEPGMESSEEEQFWDAGQGRAKKPLCYNLMSITENPELLAAEEPPQEDEKPQQDQILKNLAQDSSKQAAVEKAEALEPRSSEDHIESSSKEAIPQEERSIMNGMMEILPIFSNHDFACSRDAISIEESDELDTPDKPCKFLSDGRSPVASARRGLRDRLSETLWDLKDLLGDSFLFKDAFVSDRTIFSSSHFINFLLVLTPFSEERERILNEQKLEKEALSRGACLDDGGRATASWGDQKYESSVHKSRYNATTIILAIFVVIFFFLTVAWKNYQPPGIMYHILNFIPFIHCRRSYLQTFFDRLITIAKKFGAM